MRALRTHGELGDGGGVELAGGDSRRRELSWARGGELHTRGEEVNWPVEGRIDGRRLEHAGSEVVLVWTLCGIDMEACVARGEV